MQEGTVVFGIELPYLSKSLTLTYNKKLIVHEYIYKNGSWNCTKTHEKLKSGWKERNPQGPYVYDHWNMKPEDGITEEEPHKSYMPLFYDNFEMAVLNKLVLLGKLKKKYLDEIALLEQYMKKNIPDVKDEIDKYKETYPELFL